MTTQVPEFGGCLWPVDAACFTDEWNAHPPEVQDRALALASATLQRLTGNRVSNCPVTIRPCRPEQRVDIRRAYVSAFGSPAFAPFNYGGEWVNVACAGGDCETDCEVLLPGPVGRIDSVKVDGVVLEPTEYRLDSGSILVWTGEGECPWPATQNMRLPDTEVGTFSITYLNAYPVDSIGAYAVGVLAREYAKACSGQKCKLPTGVTSITRQGVSMELVTGAFPGGMTGIREVDTFIALWNPTGLQRQASVWSPDLYRSRVQGGPR